MSGGRARGAPAETLLRAERRQAAAVLVASHADHPGFAWLWPDPAVRRRALRPFLRATVGDVVAHGSATVGRDAQGRCAVALWLPPESFPWSLRRTLRAGLARADADGAACWVETSGPANVGSYRALGLEVAEPRLEHLPSGPPSTGLRRPPRR